MKKMKKTSIIIGILMIASTLLFNVNKQSLNSNLKLEDLQLVSIANAEDGECTQNFWMILNPNGCQKCWPDFTMCCEVSAQCCENEEPYC